MPDEEAPNWPDGFNADLMQYVKDGSLASTGVAESLGEIFRLAAVDMLRVPLADPGRHLMGERAEFEAHFEARWGNGLDLMELFIEEVLDTGQWLNALYASHYADASEAKYSALIRLQGRGAMTPRGVLTLLRSGFSSGVMARWRTLHEVWVIFSVLKDGNDELSCRYLAHDEVEKMKGQDDYKKTWAMLGYDPPDMTAEQR